MFEYFLLTKFPLIPPALWATGGLEVAIGPLFNIPPTPPSQGGVYPSLYPSPWTKNGGAKASGEVSFPLPADFLALQFWTYFSDSHFLRHRALWEPTCPLWVANLASKTRPTSMVFGVQETSYVARRKNVKICTTLTRKPCFCLPRTPKKPPKIYQKVDLKSLLC